MSDENGEGHYPIVLESMITAISLVKLLPQSDIVEEVEMLLSEGTTILIYAMEGRHYGTEKLDDFLNYCDTLNDEATKISNAMNEDIK